jgi:SNF2 family DNA or RNA helicase
LIVCPPGIDTNWELGELPKHVPSEMDAEFFAWYTDNAKKKSQKLREKRILENRGKFVFVAISYNAFCTEAGKAFAKAFLTSRPCLLACDESHRIKNPKAMTTKVLLAASSYARYRRILTGTPVTNGPFDIFSQMKFLDKDFWKKHGVDDFYVFRNYFGEFEKQHAVRYVGGKQVTHTYDQLVRYRNLDKLYEWISPYSSRLKKCDVLDLPEKIFTQVYYTLSGKHLKAYTELEKAYMTFVGGCEGTVLEECPDLADFDFSQCVEATEEAGELVTAELPIVRLLRLQQVLCGYVSTGPGEPEILIDPKDNPRLKILLSTLEDVTGAVMIWCRFRKDIDLICEALGDQAVRYDGQVDKDQRQESLRKIKSGEARFFVVSTSCSEGYTLLEATTVIRYSSDFRLMNRLQADDRPHRIGQTNCVTYIDIICRDTVDEKISESLKNKEDVASVVNGDKLRKWLKEQKSKKTLDA